MYIRKLHLKNYGKFYNKTLELTPGINLIYGENESGKTTIYHFIKSMLFGTERQRGKMAKNDVYRLYEPWENSLFYEGELRFHAGGRNFRIERGFHKAQKKENFVNEDDAEELSIAHGDLTQILDGLNESIFKNTMAISQLKSETDEGLANELKNYTSGFSLSGDGTVNVANVLSNLLKLKKEQEANLREIENKKQIKLSGIQKEKEYIQTELAKKNTQLNEYIGLHKSREDLLFSQKQENETKNKVQSIVIQVILILAALTGVIVTKQIVLQVILALTGAAFSIGYHQLNKKTRDNKNHKIYENDGERNRLIGAIEELKADIRDKEIMFSNMNEKLKEMQGEGSNETAVRTESMALNLAIEQIQAASMQLQKEISDDINNKASEILSFITNDKYKDIRIDSKISTRLNMEDKMIYPEQVSKGTVDEINFAVRMAFLELFFREEKMPVILDDAFAMYDNKRLARALQYLENSKRQVILFTCHKREEQLMNQLEIPYHKILLSNEN
jgi:uncharacterized protein YhaN